jgi:Tfp pilus assembly protein PilX
MKLKLFINKLLKSESGFSLPLALIVMLLGGLIVVPSLLLMDTSLSGNTVINEQDDALYAADAGIQYAIWHLKPDYQGDFLPPEQGQQVTLDMDQQQINGNTVEIEISNVTEEGDTSSTYRIQSTATKDIQNTDIVSYISVTSASSGSSSFDYALCSLDGDIVLTGQTETESDEVQEGDVYAIGSLYMNGQAKVNGDATTTGTIVRSGQSRITGDEVQYDTSPPPIPTIDTPTYRDETLAAEYNTVINHTGSWTPSAGAYPNTVGVEAGMTITNFGSWTFGNKVSVGLGSGGNLYIGGFANVVFDDVVYVHGNLQIDSFANVTFNAPVIITGSLIVSGMEDVNFGSTIYVGANLTVSSQTSLILGGTVYVEGNINASGQCDWIGGETIIAGGTINLSGQSQLSLDDIPIIVSLASGSAVTISGQSWTSAIVFAPNGSILLSGQSMIYGSAVAKSIRGEGQSTIKYPLDLSSREDLPRSGSSEAHMEVLQYTIQDNS